MAVLATMFFALFGLLNGSVQQKLANVNGSTKIEFADGVYTVPVKKSGKMLVTLVGAGGAGGAYKGNGGLAYAGGGGAFVSCYLDVKDGDQVKFKVGQGGRASGYGADVIKGIDSSGGMRLIFQKMING